MLSHGRLKLVFWDVVKFAVVNRLLKFVRCAAERCKSVASLESLGGCRIGVKCELK
jgi:hypothetical protein